MKPVTVPDRVKVRIACWYCPEPGFMFRVPPWDRCWCQVCGWTLVEASCAGFATIEVAQ